MSPQLSGDGLNICLGIFIARLFEYIIQPAPWQSIRNRAASTKLVIYVTLDKYFSGLDICPGGMYSLQYRDLMVKFSDNAIYL